MQAHAIRHYVCAQISADCLYAYTVLSCAACSENDVNWTNGGMPDDITVVAMRIVSKAVEVLAEDEDDIELANRRLPMSFTTQAQAVQGSC